MSGKSKKLHTYILSEKIFQYLSIWRHLENSNTFVKQFFNPIYLAPLMKDSSLISFGNKSKVHMEGPALSINNETNYSLSQ